MDADGGGAVSREELLEYFAKKTPHQQEDLYAAQVMIHPEDKGPYASYPKYSRANAYPWSPFPPRRARPGPGPRILQRLSDAPEMLC